MTQRRRATDAKQISFMGLTFTPQRWAIGVLSAIACVGAAGVVFNHVAPELTAVVSLKQANDQLKADTDEYNKHIFESPEIDLPLFDDARGSLRVRIFHDGCILFQRRAEAGTFTRLMQDLARQSAPPVPRAAAPLLPVVEAGGTLCQDPHFVHPGPFVWVYGARQGEWIEVWRAWPDGCQHVQMQNTRTGWWDSNPDGSPRVRWTRCIH